MRRHCISLAQHNEHNLSNYSLSNIPNNKGMKISFIYLFGFNFSIIRNNISAKNQSKCDIIIDLRLNLSDVY